MVGRNLQTLETTRRLGEIDRDLILEVLKSIYARRMAGDIDGMMNLLSPDIVCFPSTSWGGAHYARCIKGKDAVREAFWHRHINYVNVAGQIHRILIDGAEAVVHRSNTIRERGSCVTHTFDSVDFLRFRDGLVTEFCEMPDGRAYDAVVNFPH